MSVGSIGDNLRQEDSVDLFQLCSAMDAEQVHIRHDRLVGLKAVIVIHNTHLGPGLGGCRLVPYATGQAAIFDAMRLAQGMSFKAAIHRLPYGGAKAVIMRPGYIPNREALFESLGDFIDQLKGHYITAPDSGTGVADMDVIARRTRYVTCTSDTSGDPSPSTARGVLWGIQAAVKIRLGRSDLDGLRVMIQGVGKVGYQLARMLYQRGAELWVSDLDPSATERCVAEFGAQVIKPGDVYDLAADVFSPCALGGSLSRDSISRLHCAVVAGSANNQLAEPGLDQVLHDAGILYAPDYVINAGGLISAVTSEREERNRRIEAIYEVLLELFARARWSNQPAGEMANQIALGILNASQEAA